ncbi:MAG: nucleoside deaminase, partial [Candidatus Melainabacteria bacterium]
MQPDVQIMKWLIKLAQKSHSQGGHAVSAAVVKEGVVISTGSPTLNQEPDPTAHAEINAIRAAAKNLDSRFLDGCY